MARDLSRLQKGFSTLEAVMSVAIVSIGFVGVFAMIGVSSKVIDGAFEREELALQSREAMETIISEKSAVESFSQNLSNCANIKSDVAKPLNADQIKAIRQWCERISSEVGAYAGKGKREIRVEKKKNNKNKDFHVVSIELTNSEGKNRVVAKRVFYAR